MAILTMSDGKRYDTTTGQTTSAPATVASITTPTGQVISENDPNLAAYQQQAATLAATTPGGSGVVNYANTPLGGYVPSHVTNRQGTVYYNTLPGDLTTLKPGDSIMPGDKLNYQNTLMQQLLAQGVLGPLDSKTGYSILKPYQASTTLFDEPKEQTPEDFMGEYNKLIKAQQDALEQQYQNQINAANASYDANVQQTKDYAGRAAGSLARLLGRAGGFTTTAGALALDAQGSAVQGMIMKLGQQRDTLLGEAIAAKQAGNVKLFEAKLDKMYQLQKELKDEQYRQAVLAQNKYEKEQTAIRQANQDLINFQEKGWVYVKTPAERDKLKAQGYEIVVRDGKTYAKAPAKKSVKSGGGSSGGNLSEMARAVISGTLKLTDLTPTQRAKIAGELNAAGYKSPETEKLTPEETAFQKDLSDSLKTLAGDKNQWGPVWNYMYSRYGKDLEASAQAQGISVNDAIDKLLNKDMFNPAQETTHPWWQVWK